MHTSNENIKGRVILITAIKAAAAILLTMLNFAVLIESIIRINHATTATNGHLIIAISGIKSHLAVTTSEA